ncbi:AAA family ATPase [Priestia megaterium]|nr:AAA family ATPase [Priestia megaterium]
MKSRSVSVYLKEWIRALSIEIEHLKTEGGQRQLLINGEYMGRDQDSFIYRFQMTSDLYLIEGSLVRLVFQETNIDGEILSSEGEDLYIKTSLFLGSEVESIDLYNEPWELLQALIDRLDELKDYQQKKIRVMRLMSGEAKVNHIQYTKKNDLHEILLRAHYNQTTYIWGPPGTGKTYTLARIINSFYRKRKRVLVLSHSNAAVDVLMAEAAKCIMEKQKWNIGDVIRYGSNRGGQLPKDLSTFDIIEHHNPSLLKSAKELEEQHAYLSRYPSRSHQLASVKKKLNKLRSELFEIEQEVMNKAYIIGTTLAKMSTDRTIYKKDYDAVIIDEISMAYTPQVAFAASLGKRVIVCGDFKQLPPVSQSARPYVKEWLNRDLFEQVGISTLVEKGQVHPHLFILKKQRRMHPDISSFTNEYIYGGRVYDHPSVESRRELSALKPFINEAALFINTSKLGAFALKDKTTGSRYNLISALLASSLLIRAFRSGLTSLGYVTPYKAQANLVKALLKDVIPEGNILTATVHKFQGSERDMIIFDVVDSPPQTRPGVLLTNETSDRLVNVAVTRARGKFIMVGDEAYLSKTISASRSLNKLLQYFKAENRVYEPIQYLKEMIQHSKFVWYKSSDYTQLKIDLQKNSKRLVISIPSYSRIDQEVWTYIREFRGDVTILAKEPAKIKVKGATIIASSFPLSILIIDDKILWLNMPDAGKSPALVTARIESANITSQMMNYIEFEEEVVTEQQQLWIQMDTYHYSFEKYLLTWDRCPDCQSTRQAEKTKNGKVRLICHHCGNTGGVTRALFEEYLRYIHAQCRNCQKELEVAFRDGVYAYCPSCEKNVFPREMLLI